MLANTLNCPDYAVVNATTIFSALSEPRTLTNSFVVSSFAPSLKNERTLFPHISFQSRVITTHQINYSAVCERSVSIVIFCHLNFGLIIIMPKE